MYIERLPSKQIASHLVSSSKVIILYGPRQVGKTTLINHILKGSPLRTLKIDADESKHLDILGSKDVEKIRSFTSGYDLLVIDEAQQIPHIGTNLKLIHDHISEIKVMVTGSSSFNLSNKVTEPLTGRYWSYELFPISFSELKGTMNENELNNQLEDRLIYGSYPELFQIQSYDERKKHLNNLCNSYLFKDVLKIAQIRNSEKLRDLLKLLAFQMGNEVSLSELGSIIGMSKDTIAHYIDLLEKSYVLFRLRGLSRNLRKEVSKMDKIYFYDLGIRNSIIDMVKPLGERNDVGQLWENFLIVERMKHNAYQQEQTTPYFWRLHTGAELDYVEEVSGQLNGYEFKWGSKNAKCPKSWSSTYPKSTFKTINRD
ncbi:AAA family ATPase, partial [Candidatus Roizmanbacteria bacterium CG_4_10_14_0_8_um_filter_39_9]